MSKKLSKIIVGIFFTILFIISFKTEVFKIMGSEKAFTLSNLIAPISLNILPAWFVVPLLILSKTSFDLSLISLLFTIPSLTAMISYKYYEKRYGIIAPILSMGLFFLNPIVGFGKSVYFLLWLIPIYTTFHKTEFSRAITSTFNAHAVGSIIFLYFINPMNPLFWNTLIPIALVERLFFSTGISVSSFIFKNMEIQINKFINKTKLFFEDRYNG